MRVLQKSLRRSEMSAFSPLSCIVPKQIHYASHQCSWASHIVELASPIPARLRNKRKTDDLRSPLHCYKENIQFQSHTKF
ncbi:Uncharacterized protein TCM_029750 [Theobroma cacao]|uniref:Uncharacterized protein n=1 Tax=Theobroma cacao TaxID=3641 RepID=A0A061GG01_THECC|nr:Uncharacterized protein TCM_029750 [Theobroma cacao]